MAMCFAKPSPVSLHAALFPRHGIKWAVLRAPLSLSRGVEVRASGAKGARLVTLVGKGGARKTTAAVLAAQVSQCGGMVVENVGVNSQGSIVKGFGQVGLHAGAISSSVVAKCAVLRQHRLALLPPHPISRPHRRCYAGSKAGAGMLEDAQDATGEIMLHSFLQGVYFFQQLGEWEKALELYEGNRPAGLRPTVSTYNALMTALCEAKQFDQALAVLTDLKDAGMRPNQITCSILLKACEKDGRADMALDLYMNARAEGIKPNQVICDCDSILGLCLQKIQSSAVAPQICSSMLPVPADSSNVSPQDKWAKWDLELFIAKP